MILIVASQFDKPGGVVKNLEQTALAELEKNRVKYQLVQVPGAVEIPITVQHFCSKEGANFQAVIALGCVVKGGTDHYEMVIKSVTEGLTRLALDLKIPIMQGVLACHDDQDARDRSNLGTEYARTALEMIKILK